MKLEQLVAMIAYERLPERPEGISVGRWLAMIHSAADYLHYIRSK